MRSACRSDGETTAFVIAALEPAYHDVARALYYLPVEGGFAKHFPADTPHLARIYQQFARHVEDMILQTARVRPAPWDKALDAFLEVIRGEDIRWRLAGSVALAVRGIDVAPRDLDLVVDNAGAQKLGALLLDCLVEPVLRTPGWIANWFGRAFLHARVEWIGVDDPYALAGLQVVHWRGVAMQSPPLEMHLEEDRQRGLTERADKIARYLASRQG